MNDVSGSGRGLRRLARICLVKWDAQRYVHVHQAHQAISVPERLFGHPQPCCCHKAAFLLACFAWRVFATPNWA